MRVGAVKWWRSEDGGGFPSLAAPLSDQDREYRWGVTAEVNLVPRAGRPQPLYMAQCDGAHQPCRVGRPRSGHENKAQKVVGPNDGRLKPNILSLDLSLFSSFFNVILKTFYSYFSCFYLIPLQISALNCLIVTTISAVRLTATTHFSVLE
jgi:hypothetical protein